MVVLDSSAVIPLARVGALRLIQQRWVHLVTTPTVRREVLEHGQPGTAALSRFFADVDVERPVGTAEVADQTGVSEGDAAVTLLANGRDATLLGNDSALFALARSLGVEPYWVPSLVLDARTRGLLSADDAEALLLDLVDDGMGLRPRVYARLHRKIRQPQ